MFKITKKTGDAVVPFVYFGLEILIPRNTAYLATDEDGGLWAYTEKPEPNNTFWSAQLAAIAIVELEFEGDWRDSLVEVIFKE